MSQSPHAVRTSPSHTQHPEQAPASAEPPALEIDWIKTAAGALAAVTAAVILSTLGAVGTLVGAAVGSVAATVGSAIYSNGLARSKRAVLRAQETALLTLGVPTAAIERARDEVVAHDPDLVADATADADPASAPPRSIRPRWKRVAVLAVGTFVVVMTAITGFEIVSGHSVSSYTGGSSDQSSTVRDLAGGGGTGRSVHPSTPTSSQSPSTSPSASPSASATASATATASSTPTSSASSTASATTSSSPSSTPTASSTGPDPSASPTSSSEPTATSSPTAGASASPTGATTP